MGEYSDDDLEDLPESALQQLEDNAIQSTQAPRLIVPTISQQARARAQAQAQEHSRRAYPDPPPFDALGLDDDDDDGLDFDGSDVLSHSIGAMPRALAHPPVMQQQASRTSFPDRSQGHPSQARWKNQIPPPPPGSISRPVPSQSFRPPALHIAPSHRPQPAHFPRGFAPPPPRYAPSQSQSQLHPNAVTALEQRLRSLESELHISRGEASILRANSTKSQAAADAEIALLRKQNAEYLAKHERAVQAAAQAEKIAATEMKFMQKEMQEMMARARRRDTGAGAGAGAGGSPGGNTTPKKGSRTWGVADGFDGMDLVSSPSKNVPRTKSAPMPSMGERTPTKAKRKRPVDSPVPPLDTTEDVVMADGRDVVDVASKPAAVAGPPAALHSLPFDFLPLILDHSSAHGRPPTFDSLARYFYPSDPTTSFSSIIFQSLPTKVDPAEPMRILSSFSSLVVNLWARCLQEEFFLPIRELVSLLTFTLQLHSVSIVPPLIDKLLPVAQTTLHVIADVRAAANSSDEALGANPDFQALRDSLDSTAVVALLNLCALVCTTAAEPLSGGDDTPREAFWKGFAMETVSLVLGSKQPLADITGMLEMLATSVLRDSIGPVVQGKEPALVAGALIDKLSRFLMYPPASARSPAQRHAVVAAALRTLVSFSAQGFAAREMAVHENLVLRVIAMLSRSVDELYDQELSSGTLLNPQEQHLAVGEGLEAADGDGDGDGDMGGLCAVISLGVLLLHGLLTDPLTAGLVGLERKFEAWKGGGHKYLVVLCRLNFAEDDGVLEAGVDVETAERAHELLEMLVSVEGGGMLGRCLGVRSEFGSPE